MPTKITETNKKKVTSHHIHVIKPRNLLEASVDLKCITIIVQCTQQKRLTVHVVTQEAKKACSLLLKSSPLLSNSARIS